MTDFAPRTWIDGERVSALDINRLEAGVAEALSKIEGERITESVNALMASFIASGHVIVGGHLNGDLLVLGLADGTEITAGNVRGNPGPAGIVTGLTMGSVTTLAKGSAATVTISGTAPNLVLNLGVPRGEDGLQGVPGPLTQVDVGTVTTGTPGTPATVTATGPVGSRVLNFVIPMSDLTPALSLAAATASTKAGEAANSAAAALSSQGTATTKAAEATAAAALVTTGVGAFVVLTPGQVRPANLQAKALILRIE